MEFISKIIIVILMLSSIIVFGQIEIIESALEYKYLCDQIHVQISDRMMNEFNLDNNYIQLQYYNAKKDDYIDPEDIIKNVFSRSFKVDTILNTELFDCGNTMDKDPDDSIYANYIIGDFDEFRTIRFVVDIITDSIRISRSISYIPVEELLRTPEITFPFNNTLHSAQNFNIYWQVDSSANCGIMLFEDHSENYIDSMKLIWTHKYPVVDNNIMVEDIPSDFKHLQDYLILSWSNSIYHRLYSFDCFSFTIDTTNNEVVQRIFNCYPNPFREKIFFEYSVFEESEVSIKVYDLTGNIIYNSDLGLTLPGKYTFSWNGRNILGEQVSAGVYICRFTSGTYEEVKKAVLIK